MYTSGITRHLIKRMHIVKNANLIIVISYYRNLRAPKSTDAFISIAHESV